MNNSKKIILATILLSLISAVYLSWMEKRQADLNLNKNWWVLSFDNPKSNDVSFAIENHSQKTDFHWEIFSGNVKIKAGDAVVANGTIWTSNVQVNNLAGKISIIVTNGADKKEIYKNL